MSHEPDYEQFIEDREEARDEAWLHRMDARYGRVEDYRTHETAAPADRSA